MILQIPKEPSLIYAFIAIGTAFLTLLGNYLINKNNNNSKVKLKEFDISKDEREKLKIDFKNALEKIKTLQSRLNAKENELNRIKSDFRAVKIAFQVMFKGYEKIFKEDEDSFAMLNEMKDILDREYKDN